MHLNTFGLRLDQELRVCGPFQRVETALRLRIVSVQSISMGVDCAETKRSQCFVQFQASVERCNQELPGLKGLPGSQSARTPQSGS
jgi:hypothetical protein